MEGKQDKIVSYDLKRHVYTHLKILAKPFSMMMNKSNFPLYKIVQLNERLVQIILSDKYIVVNLKNLVVTEDNDLDLYYHNNSQKDALVVRGGRGTSNDLSYSFSCLHDIRNKPTQRSIFSLWAYYSQQEGEMEQLPNLEEMASVIRRK